MKLPPQFLDELRARTPMAALVGRKVKLSRSGRQWKGCCPFHGEKTPSFYVYEDGFHCFGCGAHGDAVSFVMQTQGAGFMEAVKSLAGEAGLEVPRPSPEAAEQERRRLDLHEVLERAAAFFAARLRAPEGAAARRYLAGRGVEEERARTLGLGWSGEGRGALAAAMAAEGLEAPRLLEAGLLREGENGPPRELFFNRLMFPIRDRSGRMLSFGGRILGEGQPKYLNGPETPVFSKRRTLYGLDRAREAVRGGAAVVAVEGYMDVIALHGAGFGAAVAPLGTALTAEQLEALWRLAPCPVLCFDGDAAGRRAALRAAEVALPLLTPERTLRVASLPEGEDPDTLVRGRGAAGFGAVLEGALPLADALFAVVSDGVGTAPEARAGLLARLDALAGSIADRGLASEYRGALRDRFYAQRQRARDAARGPAAGRGGRGDGRGEARRGAWGGRASGGERGGASGGAAPAARRPPDAAQSAAERLRILFAIVLRHPELVHDVEEAWCTLTLPTALATLRDAVLAWASRPPSEGEAPLADTGGAHAEHVTRALDSETLLSHLHDLGHGEAAAAVLARSPEGLPQCARPGSMPAEGLAGWWHFYGFVNRAGLEQQVADARRAFELNLDETTQRRLTGLTAALRNLDSGEPDADAAA